MPKPTKKVHVHARIGEDHKHYRRAGLVFSAQPSVHDVDESTLAALKADPRLVVVDHEAPLPMPKDEAVQQLQGEVERARTEADEARSQQAQAEDAWLKLNEEHEQAKKAHAAALERIAKLEQDLATGGQARDNATTRAELAEKENGELKAKVGKLEQKLAALSGDDKDVDDPDSKKKSSRRI